MSLLDAGGREIVEGERIGATEKQIVYRPEQTEILYILVETRFGFSDLDSYHLIVNEGQVESGRLQIAQVRVFPNPVPAGSMEVTFAFRIPNFQLAEETKLDILNSAGDLLYTDVQADVIGSSRFLWAARSGRGGMLSSGIYLYVISATRGGQTVRKLGKMALIK